nr:MAG: hypothetical protein [Microviridae sp.]
MIEVDGREDGETIEEKIYRLINDKEPIKDGAPPIFTERKDGVNAAYNIRTDRFEIAVEAMDRIRASKAAKRDEASKPDAKIIETKDGKAEPTHGKADEKSQSS